MAVITLDGAIRLDGGSTHVHAARRLRESFSGIDWTAHGDGPVPAHRQARHETRR